MTSPFPEVVLASRNAKKIGEVRELLDPHGVPVTSVSEHGAVPDVVEDADTLVGNARLKAIAICDAAGLPAVADDTGLEVDALGGAPGVYAARYAGEGCSYADNRAKLLAELGDTTDRAARFRTSVVVRWPDGTEIAVDGVCEGSITRREQGERGFGYDAVFVPADGDGRTFAEMTDDEKHAISHRGRAFRNLLDALR